MNREIPLFYYYSWGHVSDKMIPNILAEFRENGADGMVFSHIWGERILKEPEFYPYLMTMIRRSGLKIGEMHGLWGAAFDLNCSDMPRRSKLIDDHKLMMAYAADAGCKTYTMHVGAYSWVFEHVPMPRLRELALDSIDRLLPEAERLKIILAVENSYEPPNSPTEVRAILSQFSSPYLGCCFDTGHANLMSPFPGKKPEKYFSEIHDAWWEGITETENALEQLREWIVTTHIHDNDGYSDAHNLPGSGRIDWAKQIAYLRSCPRLISMQTEVRTIPDALPVRKIVETFEQFLK